MEPPGAGRGVEGALEPGRSIDHGASVSAGVGRTAGSSGTWAPAVVGARTATRGVTPRGVPAVSEAACGVGEVASDPGCSVVACAASESGVGLTVATAAAVLGTNAAGV